MHLFSLFITLLLLFFLTTRLSINCGSAPTAESGSETYDQKYHPSYRLRDYPVPLPHRDYPVPLPHHTARISSSQFSYAFQVSPGEKILRLHFNPVPYKGFKRFNDLFSVEAGPFPLLGEFVDGDQLINYSPPIMCHGNATLAIAILALINIIVHKLREIHEARSVTEEENKPSARAERLCRRFSLAEIRSATKNFSEALLLGRGGFGRVYMGFIDNGRETVAVKRLKSNSTQGKHEFLTEIETLCELRHINLVSLIGYCSDHKEMILVYEYMPSGTLADHLFKYERKGNDSCSLTWKQRLNICIGTARGLEYLHTGHGVIHRDVKASNILLDENLVAKVSDFGLAKVEDRRNLQSHVSTEVKGTCGYLDPYYLGTCKLTRKSDIYAFGVVLLEVLCGRRAIDPMLGKDECFITRWAQNRINEGEVDHIVASSLLEEILPDSLKVFVEVAERCLHEEPKKRPTMSQVVVQLESALEHQESGKTDEPNHISLVANDVCPSKEGMMPSENTKKSAEASEDVHTDTSPPTKQSNINLFPAGEDGMRERKLYKPRVWALFAFWNCLKPSKRKELSIASGFRE